MSKTPKISLIFFTKHLLNTSEFKTNEVEYILEEEFTELTGSPKQIGLLSALAISAKGYQCGVYLSCKRWNESNRVWDFFSYFNGLYAD